MLPPRPPPHRKRTCFLKINGWFRCIFLLKIGMNVYCIYVSFQGSVISRTMRCWWRFKAPPGRISWDDQFWWVGNSLKMRQTWKSSLKCAKHSGIMESIIVISPDHSMFHGPFHRSQVVDFCIINSTQYPDASWDWNIYLHFPLFMWPFFTFHVGK